MPLSISKVKCPTIRIRISCFPISRCHIFVKARPMAESGPRLQHPWINRRCGCDKRDLTRSHSASRNPMHPVALFHQLLSYPFQILTYTKTPLMRSFRNFSGHLLTKELGLASIVGPGELCHGTSLTSYKSTSFSSLCLIFSDFYLFHPFFRWFNQFFFGNLHSVLPRRKLLDDVLEDPQTLPSTCVAHESPI